MDPSGQGQDPVVRQFREQISACDREILTAVNARIDLVARLHVHKRERAYPPVDPVREEALVADLVAANPGPLSPDGLRELYAVVLDLTKREIARPAARTP